MRPKQRVGTGISKEDWKGSRPFLSSTLHTALLYVCIYFAFNGWAISPSLFLQLPHTEGRKWGKEAIEFPLIVESGKVQGHSVYHLSHADTELSLNPFLCPSPFTHTCLQKSPPLHSWTKLFHLILVHTIFYSSLRLCLNSCPCGEPWWMCWAQNLWSSVYSKSL